MVVTVRTDQGDLVLDNLRSEIVAWRRTGYQFIMRQSGDNPQLWVALSGGKAASNQTANAEIAETSDYSDLEEGAPGSPSALAQPVDQREARTSAQIGDPLDLTHLGHALTKRYVSAKRRLGDLGSWARQTSLAVAEPAVGRLIADGLNALDEMPTVPFVDTKYRVVFAALAANSGANVFM